MTRRRIFLTQFVALLFFAQYPTTVTAQVAKQKIHFASVNEAGLLTGENGEALMLNTINGIKQARWFAGVGAGFDFYGQRSVPLFLHYRQALSNRKNTAFLYGSAGTSFAWLNAQQKTQLDVVSTSLGIYYDLGAGWRLGGKNGSGFTFSAGYSLKQLRYKTPYYSIFSSPQLNGEPYVRYNYLYRRFVIKIGFQL